MITWDELKFTFDVAWDDPWYRWQSLGTIFLAVIGSVLFLWRLVPEGMRSGVLILHYNLYFGIDSVQSWQWILLFPVILLVLVATDLTVAGNLFRKDRIVSRVVLCTATLFTVLSLIGAFFVTTVNV
jgi:hypothetical protein